MTRIALSTSMRIRCSPITGCRPSSSRLLPSSEAAVDSTRTPRSRWRRSVASTNSGSSTLPGSLSNRTGCRTSGSHSSPREQSRTNCFGRRLCSKTASAAVCRSLPFLTEMQATRVLSNPRWNGAATRLRACTEGGPSRLPSLIGTSFLDFPWALIQTSRPSSADGPTLDHVLPSLINVMSALGRGADGVVGLDFGEAD